MAAGCWLLAGGSPARKMIGASCLDPVLVVKHRAVGQRAEPDGAAVVGRETLLDVLSADVDAATFAPEEVCHLQR